MNIIDNVDNTNKILSKLKILIVEDSKICQKQLKRMLNKCEIIDIIDNGLLAIDQILKTDRPYDAVFLDGQLPGLNGIEILEKLSEIKNFNNNSIIKNLRHYKTKFLSSYFHQIIKSFLQFKLL